jgi:prepilin-type N-terminal cleavage/methylation domain-containing protein
MMKNKRLPKTEVAPRRAGFTLIELLVVLAMLVALVVTLLPALAKAKPNSSAAQCLNNLRQLTVAWKVYAHDFGERLPAALSAGTSGPPRPNWMTGFMDYYSGNSSNWDTNKDIRFSPLWAYAGKNAALFKCPSDHSTVTVSGAIRPRVRSYCMNSAFGYGEFLDTSAWRLYGKSTAIVNPAMTFLFGGEHPGSINDGIFKTTTTGAQPGDPPSAARIIDVPASHHNGGGAFSFTDGRVEIHKWIGATIRPPFKDRTYIPYLNIPAGDSWLDAQWLAANTTAKR